MIKKLFNFLIVTIVTVCGFVDYAIDGEYLDKELMYSVQAQASQSEQNVQACEALLSNIKNIKDEELVPYYEFNLSYGGHTYKLHYDTQKEKSQNFMINEQSKKWGRDGNHKEAVFALSTLIKMGVEPAVAFDFLFPRTTQ